MTMPRESNLWGSDFPNFSFYDYERYCIIFVLGVLNPDISPARSAWYELLKGDHSELQLRVSHEVTGVKYPRSVVYCDIKLWHSIRLGLSNVFPS